MIIIKKEPGMPGSRIQSDAARTNLVDAIADLAHVIEAEKNATAHSEDLLVAEISVEVANALPTALGHYRAEAAGEDGIEIIQQHEHGVD